MDENSPSTEEVQAPPAAGEEAQPPLPEDAPPQPAGEALVQPSEEPKKQSFAERVRSKKKQKSIQLALSAAVVVIVLAAAFFLYPGSQTSTTTSTSSTSTTTSTSTSTTTTSTTTTSTTTTTTIPVVSSSDQVRLSAYEFKSSYIPEKSYLEHEWIELKNDGDVTVNMTGWRVKNKNYKDTFILPEFYLAPGASVKIRTGRGWDTEEDIYMNRGQEFWDNEVDVVTLFDSDLNMVFKQKALARLELA